MKYNELAEEVRMNMSREEVDEYVARGLMESGIKPAQNPGSFEMQAPKLKKQIVYKIDLGSSYKAAYFKTFETAKRFLDSCNSIVLDHDYSVGEEYPWYTPLENQTIEQVVTYCKDEVLEKAPELIKYNKARRVWQDQKNAYDYYLQRRANIVDAIQSDWNRLQTKAEEQRAIKDTYQEYLEMADQDTTIARKFLIKTYGEQQVNEVLGPVETDIQPEAQEEVTA